MKYHSAAVLLAYSFLGLSIGFLVVNILSVRPLLKELAFYKNQYMQNACSSDVFVERLADTEDEHWVLCRKSSDEKDLYKVRVKKFQE